MATKKTETGEVLHAEAPAEQEPTNPVHGDVFNQHVWIDDHGWQYEDFVGWDADGRPYVDWEQVEDVQATIDEAKAFAGLDWDARSAPQIPA